jgi:hypothetical protein
VATLPPRDPELTGVTARKVVELAILYRPMNYKASPRLAIIPKTRLERLCVEKIFEKSDLVSMRCSGNLLLRTRIKACMTENAFLYLVVQESLNYLIICVRYGRNTESPCDWVFTSKTDFEQGIARPNLYQTP